MVENLKFNLRSKKFLLIGGAALLIIIIGTVFAAKAFANRDEEEVVTYNYNGTEQMLADEVKAYLAQYMELPEQTSSDIADVAVQNYNIVMASNTDAITDEITDAVKKRIRSTIVALVEASESLTDDTLDGLSSGITEIIWNTVLSQLEASDLSSSEEYKEDYEYLIQSLQEQIDELKERKTKVSINANIVDNTSTEVTSEDVIAGIEDMSEEELLELAARMGLSIDQLEELLASSNKSISEEFDDKLEEELKDLRQELQKEITAAQGKTGETGKTGAKGEKGEKGEQGVAGKDGKTTYIAYADDIYGTNFSLTPTETSKYVGTCIISDTQQPTDAARYSNWQAYRAYVITATTDPDTGVTTVHIN